MNIVFVYDRERCLLEEDDPINAVSYFHPSWVSDVHRLTLCGQLMGVAQFLNLNFCEARTIVLQSGKFILTPFGRFVLVVGTDRCITDAALTYRSELLANVVRLYHKGLETVYEQCMANSSNYKTVTDKFYHIFEKYLPHLQHQSSVFNSLPTLKMPPVSVLYLVHQSCPQQLTSLPLIPRVPIACLWRPFRHCRTVDS